MALLTANSTEYHAFAQFTFAATTYSIGTKTELRGGVWYDGVIQTAPQLEIDSASSLGVTQASNVDLVIADGAAGIYRALFDGNILDGVTVAITLVNRFNWSDGTTTETTAAQTLTIVGAALAPETVSVHLQDVEDQKLAAVYPANLWQGVDWPDLSSDDAGKAICEPVGTALKLPCVLLRSDVVNGQYTYGVCTGSPKLYPITAVNTGTKQFTVTGDCTALLVAGCSILVTGSTANDALYTVVSATISGGNTLIIVSLGVPSSTANGNVYIMPAPLTVYRNKRIVSAAEYKQLIAYPYTQPMNGSFAAGSANWTSITTGTGTVVFGAGSCIITSTNVSNRGIVQQSASVSGGAGLIGARFALQVTLAAGSDGVIFSSLGTRYQCPAGTTTTVFLTSNNVATEYIRLAVLNDSGTAVFTKIRQIPLNLSLLQFTQPQIDFNGTPYTIEADALGVESRNAATEIKRMLGNAGVTADSATFAAAAAVSFAQNVDCDYGRAGQRKIGAIIDDLLYVARAGLFRNGTGAYAIWQDVAGSPVATLDESLGDSVKVDKYDSAGRPASVTLSFAPSSSDANTMQITQPRNVVGGAMGAELPREIRYLRDVNTADQLLCYLALRRQYCRTATATLYRVQNNLGDVITLTCPRCWPGPRSFSVFGVQRIKSGNKLTLLEYNAAVYTYTAGTLAQLAGTGYQPDYSFTPPAAPSALTITAGGTRIANDSTTTAYVTCTATPPAVNWQQIWFAAIHNVTGEITLAAGSSIGGGLYGATIAQLRPGEVYKLQCYAVNSNNVQGIVQSTFNDTAIGGGATDTTFTTPGNATAPPTVASCSLFQTMGSYVTASWPAVTAKNLQGYAVEVKVGAGAFTQVWVGNALTYQITSLSYGVALQARVRALDNYGNFSAAYATSGTVTPAANVSGGSSGDIGSTTVATVNRTNTTTISTAWNNNTVNRTLGVTWTYSHSLGRIPIMGACNSGVNGIVAGVTSVSSSSISVASNCATGLNMVFNISTGAITAPASFATITLAAYSGTGSVDVW
ncbi:MAG: hypothetical protein P4L92_23025 [Rudaea sp.]|nr:hypothetical protein [Rudaea sp.]